MIEVLFAVLFTIGLNWMISLHHFYQASESTRQRVFIIILSILIGIGLGVLVL